MARQPWLWVPTLVMALLSGGALVYLGVVNDKPLAEILPMAVVGGLVMGFGFAAVTGLPAFLASRWLNAPPPTPPKDVVEAQPANHLLRGEGRGGRLYLTEMQLSFRPHRFNFQLEPLDLDLRAIESLGFRAVNGPRRTQVSEVLEVATSGGVSHRFVVRRAETWAKRLAEAALLS